MLKYIKIMVFLSAVGMALGTGVFELTRYATHQNRDAYRFLKVDSHEPVYHYVTNKYDTSVSIHAYSYRNPQQ